MSSLFLYNAAIHSFHAGFVSGQDTLVVEGNQIKAIGHYEALKPLIHQQTKLVDLGGRTILPGLHDNHIHLWKVGNLKTYMLDLRGVSCLDEMLSRLSDYHQQYPDAAWITARGFNEAAWVGGQIPTKADLDKVTTEKPVYVIRTCAHIAVTNSKAIQLAGITASTPVPQGGVIGITNGQPNGIFSETALGLITKHIPGYTKDQLKQMLLATREEMYRLGITAATDPAVDPQLLEAYYELHQAGQLGFRLSAIPMLLPDGGQQPYPIPDHYTASDFRVDTVKFFSDGGLSGKTSALKKQYKDSTEKGVLRLNKEQYTGLCKQALQKGLGIATHAIGDAAIEFVIEQYKMLEDSFPGIRKRIEHLGLPSVNHLEDMHQYNMAASMQSIFINELGKNFIRYLDEDYLARCYPIRSVLDAGILTSLSSDAPVVKDYNPFKGIEAAVTRRTYEGQVIAAHESITIAEALACYTVHAAKISGWTNTGSLEAGKLADFIVVNRDPLTETGNSVASVQVENTFVDGNCVWEKNPS